MRTHYLASQLPVEILQTIARHEKLWIWNERVLRMRCLNHVRAVLSSDQFRSVTSIDLSHCDIDYDHFVCYGIVPYFNCIVSIDLSNSGRLCDYEFEKLLQRHGPNLKVLKLNHMPKLSNYTLTVIKRCCQNLEELELRGCRGITTQGVLTMLHGASLKLCSLSLASCRYVGCDMMHRFAMNLQNLEKINVSGMKRLRVMQLRSLLLQCPKLKSIELRRCLYLDWKSLCKLQSIRPNVTFVC